MASHWEKLKEGGIIVSNDPQGLWENACDYFEWCDTNPIRKKTTITSGREVGTMVKERLIRPYTVKGLCLHCGIDEEYLKDLRASKDKTSLYYIVVSKILYIIYVQNFEMATVGIFNPVFISKALNMDKEEQVSGNITVEIKRGVPELSISENEILEKLEIEREKQKTQ